MGDDIKAKQLRMEQHKNEICRRLRWCLDNGHVPAHDHIHLAPGDDSLFMVFFYWIWTISNPRKLIPPKQNQVAPWHPDGSVNHAGVPDNITIEPVPRGFELPVDYDSSRGYSCEKCNAWVVTEGAPSLDADSQLCSKCKVVKKSISLSEKKNQIASANCHSLQSFFKNWLSNTSNDSVRYSLQFLFGHCPIDNKHRFSPLRTVHIDLPISFSQLLCSKSDCMHPILCPD